MKNKPSPKETYQNGNGDLYRNIIKTSTDGFWLVDSKGNILDVNTAYISMCGFSKTELLKMNISDLDAQETLSDIKKRIRKVIDVGSDRFESVHRRKGGSKFFVEVSTSFLPERNLFVAFIRDISKQKQTESKNTRFSRVLEESLNEIYIFDSQTLNFVDVNLGARLNIGYSLKELQKMTPVDIKPEFTTESFAELIEPLRSGINQKIEIDTVHRRKDGTLYPVEIHLQHVTDEPSFFVAIILDVTERNKMLAQLDREYTFSNSLIDTAQTIILVLNLDGTIQSFNKYMEELSGYKLEEVKGRDWFETFLHNQDWKKIRSIFNQAIGDIQTKRNINTIITKDGRELFIEWSDKTLKDSKGKLLGLLATGHDITNQKQTEKKKEQLEFQLRQSHKMEAIGTMAGGIAHNFNNMLAAVLGYADLAKDDIPENSPAYKCIEKVLVSANRAKNLVKQIMAFGHQHSFQEEKLQLDIVTHEALKSLKDLIPENIQVAINISPEVGDIGGVDSFHFKKVVINLCMNALDAMRNSKGVLSIVLENIELKSADMLGDLNAEPGNFAKLTISDTGHGIATDIIERIFDPFFTTREVGQGDGIGLSVVHGIVQKSGGMIKVESEVGKGSKFHVFLPVIAKA